jgi:hypothetical protein
MWYSTNGESESWKPVYGNDSKFDGEPIQGIAFGNGRFVAVGFGGKISYSSK